MFKDHWKFLLLLKSFNHLKACTRFILQGFLEIHNIRKNARKYKKMYQHTKTLKNIWKNMCFTFRRLGLLHSKDLGGLTAFLGCKGRSAYKALRDPSGLGRCGPNEKRFCGLGGWDVIKGGVQGPALKSKEIVGKIDFLPKYQYCRYAHPDT